MYAQGTPTKVIQVAGEIRSHDILKWGFIVALSTVGIFYLLVNIVFVSVYTPHQ